MEFTPSGCKNIGLENLSGKNLIHFQHFGLSYYWLILHQENEYFDTLLYFWVKRKKYELWLYMLCRWYFIWIQNICLMFNYRVYNNLFWILFLIQMEYPSAKHAKSYGMAGCVSCISLLFHTPWDEYFFWNYTSMYRVTHKEWNCKDDLMPWNSFCYGLFNDFSKKERSL